MIPLPVPQLQHQYHACEHQSHRVGRDDRYVPLYDPVDEPQEYPDRQDTCHDEGDVLGVFRPYSLDDLGEEGCSVQKGKIRYIPPPTIESLINSFHKG